MIKRKHGFLTIILAGIFVLSACNITADPLSSESQKLIQKEVKKGIQDFMQSEAFNLRIEKGINAYIDKQNKQAKDKERQKDQQGNNAPAVNPEKDHIRGDAKAQYSLIEYSDFECPYCKRFHPNAKKFIATNTDVNWVFRNYPLSFHGKSAQKEAEAAECAAELGGNDTYWKYIDGLFNRTLTNGRGLPNKGIIKLAEDLGINKRAFSDCVDSDKYKDLIKTQIKDGSNAGITGTPGNLLRHNATGITLPVHGAQPVAQLQAALAELRRRVKNK